MAIELVLFQKPETIRSVNKLDAYATAIWAIRILLRTQRPRQHFWIEPSCENPALDRVLPNHLTPEDEYFIPDFTQDGAGVMRHTLAVDTRGQGHLYKFADLLPGADSALGFARPLNPESPFQPIFIAKRIDPPELILLGEVVYKPDS